MKNSLDFNRPFNGMAGMTFINCFSAAYTFVEKIDITGANGDKCKNNPDNSCGGCGAGCGTTGSNQAKWFLLFDTVCGHTSQRCRFDGQPSEMQLIISGAGFYEGGTDNNVDFLFGFAGYDYHKLTDPAKFKAAIIASIDAGKPVIAKVKTGEDRFRVITGYDADALLSPNYAWAQRPPANPPACDELDALYIIGEKTAPRYTFLDGLERIIKIMEHNAAEKLWDGYTSKIGWFVGDAIETDMGRLSGEERKDRMKRVAATMWHLFNCHNFAEVFRNRAHEDLRDSALDGLCKKISCAYGYTHDLAWALIDLEKLLDGPQINCGMAEMTQLVLYKIRDNDLAVLDAIRQMLEILRKRNGTP